MFDASPKKSFSQFPLAWLSFALAFGIWTGRFFEINFYICLFTCLCAAMLALIFIRQKYVAFLILIAFIALGGFCFQAETKSIASNRLRILYDNGEFISGDPIAIVGVVRGAPELAVDGFFIELETEKAIYKNEERKVSGNVRLFAAIADEQTKREYEELKIEHKTRLRIICRLRRADEYLNPDVVSFKNLLDQKQVDATTTIKSPLLVENLGAASNNFSPLDWAYAARQNLIIDFRKYFSVSTAGVLSASILGNSYFLDKNTANVFRQGGIFHIIVISGLQITFIGGLLIFLVRLFTDRRWILFLFPNIFLWIYSLAVGADAPVVRAAVMFTALHFATVIYRQATLLNTLGLCGIILLIYRPTDLFNQSFQLTFISVAAIVSMAFPIREKLKAVGEWRPSAETPVPPNCSKKLKTFCEIIYWSNRKWQRELSHSIWEAQLFKSPAAEKLERKNLQKPLRYLFESLLISVVAQVWMIPLMVVYFHRFSLTAIFLNLWAGGVLAVEGLTALAAVGIARINEIPALPLIKFTEFLNWLLVNFGSWLAENNRMNFRLPHYSGNGKIIYFLYFLLIIICAVSINRWKPFKLKTGLENHKTAHGKIAYLLTAVSFLILLLLIIFHPFSQPTADGRLHVDFLDVGQGDSILVTLPTGETLLVDGGGKPVFDSHYTEREGAEPEPFEPDAQGIGETVVSAFLWEKGYDQIDYILATHADADHIQGLTDVAENFQIGAALFGRTPLQNHEFAALNEVLQKRSVSIIKISRGETLSFADVEMQVLNPASSENAAAVSDNNSSIVLRIIYKNRKILLSGDIERDTENELVKNFPGLMCADVVKVAHHGSRTSSTENFINEIKPALAIISVGKESPFGHPKPEVVERWKNAKASVLTTGENGTISLSTDGDDLRLEVFTGIPIYR